MIILFSMLRSVNEILRYLHVNNVFRYFGDIGKLNCFLENYFFVKTKLRIIFKKKVIFLFQTKTFSALHAVSIISFYLLYYIIFGIVRLFLCTANTTRVNVSLEYLYNII